MGKKKNIESIEDNVRNITNAVYDIINDKNRAHHCDADVMITTIDDCIKTLQFQTNQIFSQYHDCLDKADSELGIEKCMQLVQGKIEHLNEKLDKGIACKSTRYCTSIDKLSNKTVYCLAHTRKGTSDKCINKIKKKKLSKMSMDDIHNMIIQ